MAYSANPYSYDQAYRWYPVGVSAPFCVVDVNCVFLGGFDTLAKATAAAALLGSYTRPSAVASTIVFACVGAATSA